MAEQGSSASGDPATPVVSVQSVTRIYGSGYNAVSALKAVDLAVPAGTFAAVTGRSGSGQTTLLNLIGGLDTPTEGTILLRGRDITRLNEHERTALRRHEVGFVFQSFALLPTLSALENVALALHIAGVGFRERMQRARALLALVGLSERLDHRPFELSGGEQERVAVARALANRPAVILADEPTGELDNQTAREVLGVLQQLNKDLGVTILVVTHDHTIAQAADRIVALRDGRTASESVRVARSEDDVAHEEYLVVDAAGRLQLPAEYMRALGISGRARVYREGDRVILERG